MPDFNNVSCILKRSELDYYQSSSSKLAMFNRLNKANRDKLKKSHENQLQFIDNLKSIAIKFGLPIRYFREDEMDQVEPGDNDLIISCGGDGTFLSCAQKFQDSILFGMNSDYSPKAGYGSFGALTSTNRTNLEAHLNRLIADDFFIDRWSLLQVKVNGTLIDSYAVNDIYFGHNIAYKTCDITVRQSGIEQDFNCSGVLCCTGMGSHAWHYNAGGSTFSNELDAFGFLVLFPNLKIPMKYSSGIISGRHDLIMVPQRDNYIISFDSKADVITTQMGDEIRVSLARDRAVRVISFEDPQNSTNR